MTPQPDNPTPDPPGVEQLARDMADRYSQTLDEAAAAMADSPAPTPRPLTADEMAEIKSWSPWEIGPMILGRFFATVEQLQAEVMRHQVGKSYQQGYEHGRAAGVLVAQAEVDRLTADLAGFKPEPMSQWCRDGEHGKRCLQCRCLCHTEPT